ncbi:hypothetical protein BZG29_08815 [Janthinobacterium sp. LM6]|uniref:hypothetical protein n=1 Tax=Janthinobacterium sp. LM6 TaxID=1938606 RepID=UPI000983ACB7|nr:hypothetical protein [Janthinobacterium sp. LM6]AQR68447.1 hypothetical protein BZG29_08815 [Janthinobacterium sp. LM6]
MKKYMWHLYYSGTDVVDANEAWASGHAGAGICTDCGNYMPGNDGDFAVVFGDQPAVMDGEIVVDAKIAACPACGVAFGFGRGRRYADTSVNVIREISWTEFGGVLISDEIMQSLTGIKLNNVRVEKIEIR